MGYTPVRTVITGDNWSARDMNVYVKDNFAAGIPDLMTTKGDLVLATGADAADRLAVGANDTVLWSDSTASVGATWSDMPHLGVKMSGGADRSIVRDGWANLVDMTSETFDTADAYSGYQFTVPITGYYFVALGVSVYTGNATDGTTAPYYLVTAVEDADNNRWMLNYRVINGWDAIGYYIDSFGCDILYFTKGTVLRPVYYIHTNYTPAGGTKVEVSDNTRSHYFISFLP